MRTLGGIVAVLALATTAQAQCVDKFQGALVPTSGSLTTISANANSVAISGDTAFVGGTTLVGGSEHGVVFEFVRSGASWLPGAVLTAPSEFLQGAYSFGANLAIDGDTLIVGAPEVINGQTQGGIAIYERVQGVWTLKAKFFGTAYGVHLGYSVAVHGNLAVAGAPDTNHVNPSLQEAGAAFVFERVAGVWAPVAQLSPNSPFVTAYFGTAVAVHGSTVLVSARNEKSVASGLGAVYAFDLGPFGWSQTARITTLDAESVHIGSALTLHDDTAVFGSYGNGAYVFERVGPFWFQSAKLLPLGGVGVGQHVAQSGSRIAIQDAGFAYVYNLRGRVIVFEKNGSTWEPRASIRTPDGIGGQGFGNGIALDDATLVAGATLPGNPPSSPPGAYVFSAVPNANAAYGVGCVGTANIVPTIDDLASYDGCFFDGESVSYRIANGLGGSACVLLLSAGQAQIPLQGACSLLVLPASVSLVVPLFGTGAGGGSITLNSSIPLGIPAASIFLQGFVLDGGAAAGYAATNGIRLTIQ